MCQPVTKNGDTFLLARCGQFKLMRVCPRERQRQTVIGCSRRTQHLCDFFVRGHSSGPCNQIVPCPLSDNLFA